MSTVLTILAMVAGVVLFASLFGFLLIGLLIWLEERDLDPIAAVIDWACDFWEKRL